MLSFKYFILFLVVNVSSRRIPFFRKDYTYYRELNGFFKWHYQGNNGVEWTKAFEACIDENSQLYYPKATDELTVVMSLNTDALNWTDVEILVGIYDPYNIGDFITVDGSSTPLPILSTDEEEIDPEKRCISMHIETGVYKRDFCSVDNNRAFICRKEDEQEPCPTIDKGYVYERTVNKCYKINDRAKSWTDAFKTCYQEGAMLLVLDNDEEYKIMTQRIALKDDKTYFIGFHRIEDKGDFYTVTGVRLNDEAYQVWYDKVRDSNENCGVIEKNYFKTQFCDVSFPFICEMDAY